MAGSCEYCSLWRVFMARPSRTAVSTHWDDAKNGPFGAHGVVGTRPWQNIRSTPPRLDHAEFAKRPPSTRCAALGLHKAATASTTPPPLLSEPISWLHIPKCGSSFGTAIMHRGCPYIPVDAVADDGAPIVSLTERYPRTDRRFCQRRAFLGNLNGHEPVRYPEQRLRRIVSLFREPRARLLSECAAIEAEFRRAFGNGMAAVPPAYRPTLKRGSGAGQQRALAKARKNSVYANPFLREFLYSHGLSHAAIAQLTTAWNEPPVGTIPLPRCLAVDGLKGCMTKMVLGVPCAAPFTLNASLLREASRRVLDDFLFVGLTNRWDASVCLFHEMLGGPPLAVEFLNGRKSNRTSSFSSSHSLGDDDFDGRDGSSLDDAFDEALYEVAVRRFERDCTNAQVLGHPDGRVEISVAR